MSIDFGYGTRPRNGTPYGLAHIHRPPLHQLRLDHARDAPGAMSALHPRQGDHLRKGEP